jgi:hypothetical protein
LESAKDLGSQQVLAVGIEEGLSLERLSTEADEPTHTVSVSTNDRYEVGSHLTWRWVGEEIVLLHLETSEYLTLNPTGAVLWQALSEGPKTLLELTALLRSEFEVDESTSVRDVAEFMAECERLNILSSVT